MIRLVCARIGIVLMLVIGARNLCQAQDAADMVGLGAFKPFHGGDFDSIGLATGNPVLHAPLLSYPERGRVDLSFGLIYNGKALQTQELCDAQGNCNSYWQTTGQGFSVGIRSRHVASLHVARRVQVQPGVTFIDQTLLTADGSRHPVSTSPSLSYPVGESMDATGWHYPVQRSGLYTNFGSYDSQDTNGNWLSVNGTQVTDTIGRIISSSTATTDFSGCGGPLPIAAAFLWSLPGVNGGTLIIKSCLVNLTVVTPDSTYTPQVVQSIVLPDGTSWIFEYNDVESGFSYGSLTKVTMPTGGTLSYTYTTAGIESSSRWVASRTVDAQDGTGAHTWNYSYWVALPAGLTTVVTDPQGNETVHVMNQLACGGVDYETQTQYYQGNRATGTLLKTVSTDFNWAVRRTFRNDQVCQVINVVPHRMTTTLPNGLVAKVEWDYDSGATYQDAYGEAFPATYGDVLAERAYDYGQGAPGALLRQTLTTYEWQVNASYAAANMLDLPATVKILDGAGNLCAQADYTYDEPSYLTATSIVAQHGAPPGPVRGNLTTLTKWLSNTPCSPNATWSPISSHTNWYDTGEVYQSVDPAGNTTTYAYDAAFAGAYVTSITNALGQAATKGYDFNTGLVTSVTDANNQTTSFSYDSMLRLTKTLFPDTDARGNHGETDLLYPDSTTVERTRRQDAGTWTDHFTYFDGVGRPKQGRLVDPEGDDSVDTTYDSLGRVAAISNAHRSTAAATDGITTNSYDALGRIVAVKHPDGSVVQTAYASNSVTVTDETGRPRRSYSDALGRLTEVDEPTAKEVAAIIGSPATPGSGSISLSGSELSSIVQVVAPAQAVGWVTISGSLQRITCPVAFTGTGGVETAAVSTALMVASTPCFLYDSGDVSVTVNGATKTVFYGNGNSTSIADRLAGSINGDPAFPVTAYVDGITVHLTTKAGGSGVNYSLSASTDYDTGNFSQPSFRVRASGATLTGGQDAVYQTNWDSGATDVIINGTDISTPWSGQGTTGEGIASAVAQNINAQMAGSVTASASGLTVNFQTVGTGSGIDYPYSTSTSSSQGSFASYGGGNMSGTDAVQAVPAHTDYTLSPMWQTNYGYDVLGNLISVNQQGDGSTPGRNRSFTYDSLSRLLTATNPETGTIQYTYNAAGDLIGKTDARGTTINLSPGDGPIDALHRVTKKTYSTGDPAVSYFYDQTAYNGLTVRNGIGRRTGRSDASGATAWSYDSMGRTSVEQQTINGITKSTGYQYDLAGDVTNLTYPDGEVVAFGYNGAGHPISAVDNNLGLTFATKATYAPGGELTGVVYGPSGGVGGILETDSYNQRLQPVVISAAIPSQKTIFSLGYDFHLGNGDNGNVYQIANNRDNNRTQNFSYDALNRIQAAWTNGPNWGETFTIDAFGNLTNRGPVAGKTNYEGLNGAPATAQNQLTGLGYDANGNVTKNGDATYIYDAENRLSSTAGVTYTYDGDGTRVMRSDGTIDWGPGPLSRSDLSGTITRNLIFFAGKRIARRLIPANTVDYTFSDHLGSLGVMTDAAGNIEGESDYYPFGGEQVISGGLTAYKFTGKERDSESGLDYFGARYFGSNLGRFMSPDPIGGDMTNPQSLNKYAYALNNPLRFTDPTGLYVCAPGQDCSAFEKALDALRKSTNGDVARAAGAYGAAGEKNGVTVGFADLGKSGEDGVTHSSLGTDANGNLQAQSDVTINTKASGAAFDAAVGHEGSHVADAQDVVKSITFDAQGNFTVGHDITRYQSEEQAYGVTNYIFSSEGVSASSSCGVDPCKLGTGVMQGQVPGIADRIMGYASNGYTSGGKPMGPKNQGGSVVNGISQTPKATVPQAPH